MHDDELAALERAARESPGDEQAKARHARARCRMGTHELQEDFGWCVPVFVPLRTLGKRGDEWEATVHYHPCLWCDAVIAARLSYCEADDYEAHDIFGGQHIGRTNSLSDLLADVPPAT